MKNKINTVAGVLLILLVFSCSAGSSTMERDIIRSAQDTPEIFNPPTGLSWGDDNCKNPIIDPIDGSELILVRSSGGFGDYRVTGARYGVNREELLRVNCRTGGVVGVVKR